MYMYYAMFTMMKPFSAMLTVAYIHTCMYMYVHVHVYTCTCRYQISVVGVIPAHLHVCNTLKMQKLLATYVGPTDKCY